MGVVYFYSFSRSAVNPSFVIADISRPPTFSCVNARCDFLQLLAFRFNPPFQMPVGAAPHATFLYRWLHLGPVSQYLSASFSTFSHTLFVLTKVVVTTENLKISDHLTFHRFIRVWCGVFS